MAPINEGKMSKKVVVYGRQDCVYCDKTKTYLNDLSQQFEYIDITPWSKDEREAFKAQYGVKTVPVIFVDDKLIGGYNELTQQVHLL
jgi:glutaredoxin 3